MICEIAIVCSTDITLQQDQQVIALIIYQVPSSQLLPPDNSVFDTGIKLARWHVFNYVHTFAYSEKPCKQLI